VKDIFSANVHSSKNQIDSCIRLLEVGVDVDSRPTDFIHMRAHHAPIFKTFSEYTLVVVISGKCKSYCSDSLCSLRQSPFC